MSFVNAPPVVTQFRNQLLLCPALATFGIDTTKIHYPDASPTGELADPMPFIVVAETSTKRIKYAEGAIPLVNGVLRATIYGTADHFPDVGTAETLARQVLIELGSQQFGLHIRDSETGLASELSPGQRAAGEDFEQAAYRTVAITINYGLNR